MAEIKPSAEALKVAAQFRESGAGWTNFIDYRLNKGLTPPQYEVYIRYEDRPLGEGNPKVMGTFHDQKEAINERYRLHNEMLDRALAIVLDTFAAQVRCREIEACAAIADAHVGVAEKRRHSRNPGRVYSPEALDEIRTEERGEDIAAEIIARTIRERINA